MAVWKIPSSACASPVADRPEINQAVHSDGFC